MMSRQPSDFMVSSTTTINPRDIHESTHKSIISQVLVCEWPDVEVGSVYLVTPIDVLKLELLSFEPGNFFANVTYPGHDVHGACFIVHNDVHVHSALIAGEDAWSKAEHEWDFC